MLKEKVWEALNEVEDPELGVSIVGLGLVYEVSVKEGKVKVKMTLTSPGCPLAGVINEMIQEAVGELKGVRKVEIELVWDPPWGDHMISEEIKAELGLD